MKRGYTFTIAGVAYESLYVLGARCLGNLTCTAFHTRKEHGLMTRNSLRYAMRSIVLGYQELTRMNSAELLRIAPTKVTVAYLQSYTGLFRNQ